MLAVEGKSPDYGATQSEPLTPGRISKTITPVLSAPGNKSPVRTTHNDPSLRDLLRTEHLRGSTRVLQQYYESKNNNATTSSARMHKRRWSSGDAMPLLDEHDLLLDSNMAPDLALPKLGNTGEARENSTLKAPLNNPGIVASFRRHVSHVNKGFFQDARSLAEGTIPQSVVLSLVIGVVCGVAAYLYYTCLFFLLNFFWNTIPDDYVSKNWSEEHHWMYAPLISFSFALLVGLTVVYMGEPGDLPFTISCIHNEGYIPSKSTHEEVAYVSSLPSVFTNLSMIFSASGPCHANGLCQLIFYFGRRQPGT